MNISFLQILILLFIIFLLFGDFNKIKIFIQTINNFFEKKQKK